MAKQASLHLLLLLLTCTQAIPHPIHLLPVPLQPELPINSINATEKESNQLNISNSNLNACGLMTASQITALYSSVYSADSNVEFHFNVSNSQMSVLAILSSNFTIGWVGVGLGRTMLDATFGIALIDLNDMKMTINDYTTAGIYGKPVNKYI